MDIPPRFRVGHMLKCHQIRNTPTEAMQNLIEVFRTFPLLSIFWIVVPLAGGFVGSYLGFDNLNERLETNRHRQHVEIALDQIKTPVETIRRYEAQLSATQQNADVLRLIIHQYDQLRSAIAIQSRLTGQENVRDRIVSSDQIIENLRLLLGVTQTVPGPGGQALLIKTAPNTFRVIFAVPMRIPPRLEFRDLPQGIAANVVEKTNVGFTVIFTPQSIVVDKFGFTADAEL
jgi:hypothetical protein